MLGWPPIPHTLRSSMTALSYRRETSLERYTICYPSRRVKLFNFAHFRDFVGGGLSRHTSGIWVSPKGAF
ncbi:hypothetical protein SBA2_360032 [Acidobacteriia bacterium SbA2]|nr:hypothetical protein SBA2_360032 [Acidobacteriia bacterium SbA2]